MVRRVAEGRVEAVHLGQQGDGALARRAVAGGPGQHAERLGSRHGDADHLAEPRLLGVLLAGRLGVGGRVVRQGQRQRPRPLKERDGALQRRHRGVRASAVRPVLADLRRDLPGGEESVVRRRGLNKRGVRRVGGLEQRQAGGRALHHIGRAKVAPAAAVPMTQRSSKAH